MRTWELIRHALQNVLRSRLRSSLTALGVAIASGALVSMVAFALGLREQVEAPFQKLGLLNNIEVRVKGSRGEANEARRADAPKGRTPVLDDAAVQRLQELPGVQYAYPDFRLSEVKVFYKGTSRKAYAVGLPREMTLAGLYRDMLTAGDGFSLDESPEVILGQKLARDIGFDDPQQAVDESIELVAEGLAGVGERQFEFREQRLKVRVAGVFQPPGFAAQMGADAMLLPVDLMRNLPGIAVEPLLRRMRSRPGAAPEGYSQVIVRAARPHDVPRLEKAIQQMGFETHSVASRLEEVRTFFLFLEVLLAVVGTVGLVVAGLGIVNTLLMTVMERCQEIGIYKAIGASDGDIRTLFLTEAALVGLLGGAGGLGLAWIVSLIIQWGVAQYALRQSVEAPRALFDFPAWLLVGAVCYALLISIVSGLYPASRAARIDPIRALRRE